MARRLYDEKQTSVGTICQMLGISRPTFYRYIQTGAMPEVSEP
jgi:excisionase family DNA binding protein